MIDTKLLRQKIVDLAIRGKLVPQDPSDEPASELLKKVKAEKDALVKAGKIKKGKHESFIYQDDDNRYYEQRDGKTTDITDEIPFDLPNGWTWCRLGDIGYVQNGYAFKSTEMKDTGDVPIVRISNLQSQFVFIEQCLFTKESPDYEEYLIRDGDLLIAMSGATTGKIGIYKGSSKAYLNQRVGNIKLYHTDKSALLYRNIFINSQQKKILEMAYGGAQPNISGEKICGLLFPLPPLAEQQRIVEQIATLLKYVDIIDRDTASLEKSISLAKQKMLDLAIRGKLVPQDPSDEPASELLKKVKAEKDALVKAGKIKKGKHESFIYQDDDNRYYEQRDGKTTDITDEIPFDLPNGWTWCRLGDIGYVQNGYAFKSTEMKDTGDVPIVRISNLQSQFVFIEQCLFTKESPDYEEYLIRDGDLLIAMSGATTGKIGIYKGSSKAYLNQRVGNIKLYHTDKSALLYRNIFINSQQKKILEMAYGGAQPNISGEKICGLLFPLPPLAEQQRIVEQIATLLKYVDIIV